MTPEEKLIVNRLKATFAGTDEMQKVFDIVTKTLALREAELSAAKALCVRAADALYWHNGTTPYDLIDELRKAAE